MKFTTLLYQCAIVALSLAAITSSHAEDIAYPTIVPDQAVLRNPALNNMKELKQKHLDFLAKQKSQGGAFASQGSGNGFAASGSAPALTYLHNDFVYSQGGGIESIGDYQASTLNHHFGSFIYVITDELGYGSNPVAQASGAYLYNPFEQTICQDFYGAYVIPCASGQTVIGFRKWWNITNWQYSYFTYQNTSTNSPWNTLYTHVSVN